MKEIINSFEVIERELLRRLEARGCTPVTVTGYRYLCNSIISWLKNQGYATYSKHGGNQFLENYLITHGECGYYRSLKTVVFRLNDIVDNTWKDVHSDKGKKFDLSNEYKRIVEQYCKWATSMGLAAGTIRNKMYTVSWFLHELVKEECFSISQITANKVIVACLRITNRRIWGEVRVFLKYLVDFKIVQTDYSTIVPHYSKPYVLPSVYTTDEIKLIEASIDRSTTMGKRDYAMLLLSSRMGMRSGDIVKLKVCDVDCDRNELKISQEKTGAPLHLPIVSDVRIAIDDYLRVRPETELDELFLNVQAPYRAVTTSTLRNTLRKHIVSSGIEPGKRKKGPHSLRSSLASSMVNNEIPYETVRKVLGHSSNNAIKNYARIDVEKLRRYSLTPPTPTGDFKEFLYGR